MDKAVLWIGYAVMLGGGVALTALCIWLAAEAAWKAWRAWRGFFNIVEAFEALREKQSTTGVPGESGFTTPPPPPPQPGSDCATVLRGQLGVAVALLRECLGPLEVSAALIESDDTEQMEALIQRVQAFVAAASGAKEGGNAA